MTAIACGCCHGRHATAAEVRGCCEQRRGPDASCATAEVLRLRLGSQARPSLTLAGTGERLASRGSAPASSRRRPFPGSDARPLASSSLPWRRASSAPAS